MTLSYQYL